MPDHHHPTRQLIADFAAANLEEAPSLVIAAHLEACAECRAAATDACRREPEEDGFVPAPACSSPADARLIAALDRIERQARRAPDQLGDAPLPTVVRRFGLQRRRFVTPELWLSSVRLPRGRAWRAYILRAPAGFRLPPHQHNGPEYVQVLLGGFDDGLAYRAGDFATGSTGGDHRLQVHDSGPCAALIVSHGGASWSGLLRFAAPFLGV